MSYCSICGMIHEGTGCPSTINSYDCLTKAWENAKAERDRWMEIAKKYGAELDFMRDALAGGSERETHCPQYKISACYFPDSAEAELTWQRVSTGEECAITVKVTPDQGEALVEVIDPCVYHTAEKRSVKESCCGGEP